MFGDVIIMRKQSILVLNPVLLETAEFISGIAIPKSLSSVSMAGMERNNAVTIWISVDPTV